MPFPHPPPPPQDTLDETLPDTIHMTAIYLMILLTSLAIVTVSIHYYAAMAGALAASFFMMQVRVGMRWNGGGLILKLVEGLL